MKKDGTRYHRVYCDIITGIYCGKWEKGDVLPNLDTLCEQYDVGRNTVRAALCLLEENGYIVRRQRKQPEVCFDWEDENLRGKYLAELAARQRSIDDVFCYLTIAMPEMFAQIILQISDEQRKEIIDMLDVYIVGLKTCSEKEMADGLIQIYMKVIFYTDNKLMENLFYSLYYFIQVPLESKTRGNLKFKAAAAMIKYMLKNFRYKVETKNVTDLKEQIRFFCKSLRSNTNTYLKRVCRGVSAAQEQQYTWIPYDNKEYLLLAIDIVNKINQGCYRGNDILPSYAQIAKAGEVSEKTARSAVKILNDWGIVTTVNGVGSRVNEFGEKERAALKENKVIEGNIRKLAEALQIFVFTCKPVTEYALSTKTQEEFEQLDEEISYEEVMRFLFITNASPAISAIYRQLGQLLKWGSLLEMCKMTPPKADEAGLLEAFRKRSGKMLAECLYCDAIEYYEEIKKFCGF